MDEFIFCEHCGYVSIYNEYKLSNKPVISQTIFNDSINAKSAICPNIGCNKQINRATTTNESLQSHITQIINCLQSIDIFDVIINIILDYYIPELIDEYVYSLLYREWCLNKLYTKQYVWIPLKIVDIDIDNKNNKLLKVQHAINPRGIATGNVFFHEKFWINLYDNSGIIYATKEKYHQKQFLSDKCWLSMIKSNILKIKEERERYWNGQIFVKTITGKTITCLFGGDMTVVQLKTQIMDKEGIPISHQRLIFAGKQLKDNCELAYTYGISKNCTLHMSLRLHG